MSTPIPPVLEERAFAALYRAQVDFVWRVARAMGVPDAWIDDVVHDVFFVVRRRLETLEPGRAVRPWLAGITRNIAMHAHRKIARDRRRLEHVEPPMAPALPEQQLELGEAAALMEAFLAGLPEDKRIVFLLCEVEGVSVIDAARSLEVNANTMYARLRSARIEFDRYVQRLGATEPRSADGPR
ncbi:MAG: sigma-70 family RNA polymerase sigma factor [Nannocystaceae bacterium]|nr:sigma-70 family RNA polymerase sigma factor [Deltaproteobacteria bacterium]MBK8714332.1 sigma-70 family RNA polymerase sigma factor [Deltaproteobacteria bacterium]MBP7285880.1 sigma-70 family RNA polymerase sigma factor [Nannocystaceae bacterium]